MAEWKKAFTKNRRTIVNQLANPDEVNTYLFTYGIFTEQMFAEVDQEDEKEKKTRKILDTLIYRGPRSVRCLYNAFQETANDDLADLLVDYCAAIEKTDNFNDPKEWPPGEKELEEMGKQNVFTIKDLKSPLLHEYKKNDVYRMNNKVRGKVLMINNSFKGRKTERFGSDIDVHNLKELFQNLHFEVEVGKDKSAEEMVEFLKQERDKVNWNDMNCVVLILMSHGVGDCIQGNDGTCVRLKDLSDIFLTKYCPGLDGKPRLVLVQACRQAAVKGTNPIVVDLQKTSLKSSKDVLDAGPLQSDAVPSQSDDVNFKCDDDVKKEACKLEVKHPSADFLIAYATPEGEKSFRHAEVGSWFVLAVVWTFKYHAKREELHHLLIRVNRVVAKGQYKKDPNVSSNGKDKEMFTVSEVKSNLRKKFYFFPGICGEEPGFIEK